MNKYIYPKAEKWMWNYCYYLGPYEDPNTNKKYDLGVYVNFDGTLSAAIVFGNNGGDYLSGPLVDNHGNLVNDFKYQETFRRAILAGLIEEII